MVKVLNILLLFFSSLPLLAGMVVKDIDKVSPNKGKCVISGKLVSDNNKPVDFATVSLEGTSYGGVSDLNGFFVQNAPVGQYTLVVSAMGYKTVKQRVTVEKGGAATVNLTSLRIASAQQDRML